MGKAELSGLACAALILAPVFAMVFVRVAQFSSDSYRQRWGRYKWVITWHGSFLASGSSYRCEDPAAIDDVAARILTEWFDSPDGELALLRASHRSGYAIAVELGDGRGRAFGG